MFAAAVLRTIIEVIGPKCPRADKSVKKKETLYYYHMNL